MVISAFFVPFCEVFSVKESPKWMVFDGFCRYLYQNVCKWFANFEMKATTKFYLDTRNAKANGEYPLKVAICHARKTVYIPMNISLSQDYWDNKREQVTGGIVNKQELNVFLLQRKAEIDTIILQLGGGLTAKQIKEHILQALDPDLKPDARVTFTGRYHKFMETKTGRTHEIYSDTWRAIERFDPEVDKKGFEEITKDWLTRFDAFMAQTSPSQNARNIRLRNIRAVFNDAIDDEVTTLYPFRRFKIRPVATVKRSLTVEQLRTVFTTPVEPHVEQYRDLFKLIFFLIGINIVDLCNLKEITDGRIEYYRAKTKRLYSIKVEPEAAEIIEKYKGEHYLLNILDRYASYRDYLQRLNRNLQHIGEVERRGLGGKKSYSPLFPELTTYWARHRILSFAL